MNKPYKRNITQPLPPNAKVVAKGGRTVAQWTDDKGKPRQAKVAPGKDGTTRIVVGQDEKWTIAYMTSSGRKTRVAFKDYDSSFALLQRLERESAQRAEGIITGFDDHRQTPVATHLDDFMVNGPTKSACRRYLEQHRARIERIIKGIAATRLHDFDPVKIDRFFEAEGIAGHTRNEYVGSVRAFTQWATKNHRVERDPLLNLEKTARNLIRPQHPRRAITIDQFGLLLDAAQRRPLLEMLTVRTGKNKGTHLANVSERARAKAAAVGADRRLAYQLGMWACLRRNEIAQLQWGDIDLDAQRPVIRLRAHTTKGRRADLVDIFPPLLDALRGAKIKETKPNDAVVANVPSMKAIKADLALAGIAYGDDTGFTDFHALRMCCNTYMATQKVSLSARQKHLRHTDPRLTAITYMDQQHISAANELFPRESESQPNPALRNPHAEAQVPLSAVPATAPITAIMQRAVGPGWQGVASGDHMTGLDPSRPAQQQGVVGQAVSHDLAIKDAGRQGPASVGMEAGEGDRTLDIHVGNVTLYR